MGLGIKDILDTREISWTLYGDDEAISHRVQRVLGFLGTLKVAGSSPQGTSGSCGDTDPDGK